MEREELRSLLAAVAAGGVAVDDACARLGEAQLAGAGFSDLGYAKPDVGRGVRQGVSEVIYGAGKTAAQIAGIMRELVRSGQERVIVTRLDPQKSDELRALLLAQGLRMVCLDTVEENPDLKIDFVDTWEEDPEDGPEDDFLSAADVED